MFRKILPFMLISSIGMALPVYLHAEETEEIAAPRDTEEAAAPIDDISCLKILKGHSCVVSSVSFSPDGKYLASGGRDNGIFNDNTIRLWSIPDGSCLKTLEGHSYSVHSVSFSPDGKYLASGSGDRTIRLWSIPDGSCIKTLEGHSESVRSVSFSPDGKYLASGSEDRTIRLWSIPDGSCIKALEGHSESVSSVSFSPDGKYFASGSGDNTIRLWSIPDGSCIQTLKGHSGGVCSVSFSPDGKYLASGSYDNTIKLWSIPDGSCIQTLSGHNNDVYSVSFSPDGKYLASGSYDNTIRLWSIPDGSCIQTLSGHDSSVLSVSFSPDGKYLASGSWDRTIRLWVMPPVAPPFLSVKAKFDDTLTGANGLLDSGEEANLILNIANTGEGSAFGIEILPSVDNSSVTIPDVSKISGIPPNQTREIRIPISALKDAQNGAVTVIIATKEINGYDAQTVRFTLPVHRVEMPVLEILDAVVVNDKPPIPIKTATGTVQKKVETLVQIKGNGNGIIENNETVEIVVKVKNSGQSDAFGVRLTLLEVVPKGADESKAIPAVPYLSGGLIGKYYAVSNFTMPKFARVDKKIDFDWGGGFPDERMQIDSFSVIWEGWVMIPQRDVYIFYTISDDGSKLWIDDKMVVNNWYIQNATERGGSIELEPGFHKIRIEYFDNGGGAYMKLLWSSSSIPKLIIPTGSLYYLPYEPRIDTFTAKLISKPEVILGNIKPGEIKEGSFAISVPRCGFDAKNISFVVKTRDIRKAVIETKKELLAAYHQRVPQIELNSYKIYDGTSPKSRGNKNGIIEQREIIEFGISFKNKGEMYADDVSVNLSTEKKGVVINEGSAKLGCINVGTTSNPARFVFTPQKGAEPGNLPLNFTITQSDFGTVTKSVNLEILEEMGVADIQVGRVLPKVGDEIWVKIGLEDAGTIWDLIRDPNNPDIVYAATEKKGVLKSINGGLDWIAINQGIENLLIRCLAIDETNPLVLYAGSYNRGIFRSVDGGLSWEAINGGSFAFTGGMFPVIQSIKIDMSNTQIIYIGTNKGLYKTTNSGTNWVLIQGLPCEDVRCIAFAPKSYQTIYAGLGYGGVCCSTDGGATWRVLFGTNLIDDIANAILSVAIDPSSLNTIYIGRGSGGIFRSTDGGSVWLPLNNGFPSSLMINGQPLSIYSININPANPNLLYAATRGGGVYVSRDGGTNWSEYTYGIDRQGDFGNRAISVDRAGRVLTGGCDGIFEIGRIKEKEVISSVNFDFDSDKIKAEAYPILDKIVDKLKGTSSMRAVIEGHSDNIGSEEYNLDLSKRRARSIEEYLVQKEISENRLSSFGYGKSRPIESNETESGRAKNRRVEILLVGAR